MLDFERTPTTPTSMDLEAFPNLTLFEVVYDFKTYRAGWLGFKFAAHMAKSYPTFIVWFTHAYNNDGFEWSTVGQENKGLKVRALDPSEGVTLRNKERKG